MEQVKTLDDLQKKQEETPEEHEEKKAAFISALSRGLGLDAIDGSCDEEIADLEKKEAAAKRQEQYEKIAPERYWRESLDTYQATTPQQQKALAAVRSFVAAAKVGRAGALVMLGPAGTGKTHLACGALREYGGGLFCNASAIVEELRRAKSFTSKETEADLLKRYGRYSLLVIDEVGRGVNAADEQYMLYQLINERYNTRRPTIILSNYNRHDFINYIGAAAADRLAESGLVFDFGPCPSYRVLLRGKK